MRVLRRWTLLLAGFTFAVPPGCDGGGPKPDVEAGAGAKTLRIAVIPKGTTHGFWKSVRVGTQRAEKELRSAGIPVRIDWNGPPREDDRALQIQVVENFIASGVEGIAVAPLDSQSLLAPVRAATQAGIPVVIFDSGLDGKVGVDFVTFVATDNRRAGALGASRLGQVMGGKGRVILLRYQENSASTEEREQGFLETLRADFPEIEIISDDQHAGATFESANEKAQNILTRFEGKVDGIFTPNESSTFGTLKALKDAGLAGKVKFVGFDANPELVRALAEGQLQGIVLQDPVRMGYLAVTMLVAHIRGERVEPRIDTGAVVVTPENMNEPAMKALHSPDFTDDLGG